MPSIAFTSSESFDEFNLPMMRAVIISAVNAKKPNNNLKSNATSAAGAVDPLGLELFMAAVNALEASFNIRNISDVMYISEITDGAGQAAESAAFSVAFDGKKYSDIKAKKSVYAALRFDAEALMQSELGAVIFDRPLWQNEQMPERLMHGLQQLQHFWSSSPEVWGFWERWYDGFLNGTPIDWDIQIAVASLPNEDWEKGPEWIAGKIRRIERNARTAVAPPLVFDQSKRVFVIANEDPLPSKIIAFARDRISMALQNALVASSGNGLHNGSYETVTIVSVLEQHPNNASLLATAFYDASLSFASNIGELYPEDASLINLKNALFAVAEEICELSPEARQRCARLASLAVSETATFPKQPDVLVLADIVTEDTGDETREVIQSDARAIAAGGIVPKWLRARFTNYVTTIAIWIDKSKKGYERLNWLVKAVDQLLDWFKLGDE